MGSPQIVQAFSVNCTGKPCKSNLQVKPCILEITGILRNYYIFFLKKIHGMSLFLQTLHKFRICTCKVPVIPCKGLQCTYLQTLCIMIFCIYLKFFEIIVLGLFFQIIFLPYYELRLSGCSFCQWSLPIHQSCFPTSYSRYSDAFYFCVSQRNIHKTTAQHRIKSF